MAKFKVGDKVIGNDLADKYGITCKGWVGYVKKVDGKSIYVEEAANPLLENRFWVDAVCFNLAEEKSTPKPTFKVGDRVKCIKKNWGAEVGALGTVISMDNGVGVEFDEECGGHDCGCGKYGHCWWVTTEELELVKEEPKAEPIPTPVVNVNVTVNLYENACWYCRKGGLVDLCLAGAMGICPSCGRVCNNIIPTRF